MKKKTKFIISGSVVVGALIVLIFKNAMHNMQYYKTVGEVLTAAGKKSYNEAVRVAGKVEDGSIMSREGGYKLKFNILGKESGQKLTVGYNGIVPDTFKPGIEVIVEGKLDKDKVFSAETLLTKCPSKYNSEDEADKTDKGV